MLATSGRWSSHLTPGIVHWAPVMVISGERRAVPVNRTTATGKEPLALGVPLRRKDVGHRSLAYILY